MILAKFLDSLEKQWLAVVIAALWLFSYTASQEKNALLLEQTKQLETQVLILEKQAQKSAKVIDSLSKIDTLIVTKIKTIKQKEYVQIRIIDSLPVSGLQRYFSDRYPER
jgi:mannose/fructose/N-acetylgalactosamine-specific phosphotransferase system component IIB